MPRSHFFACFLILSLITSSQAQPKPSLLTLYPIKRSKERLDPVQQYRSLLDVPAVPTAGPLNALTAVAAAKKVDLPGKEDLQLLTKASHLIGKDKWAVQFALTFKDVPLAQPSGTMVLIRSDGQPLELRNRQLPKQLPTDLNPTVTPEQAINASIDEAVSHWKQLTPFIRTKSETPNWKTSYPVKEIWVDRQGQGHLAYHLLVRAEDVRVPVSLLCWISAQGTASVLQTVDMIYSSHHGSVAGSVWLTTPNSGPTHDTPLPGALITRINVGDTTFSDDNGAFQFPGAFPARDLLIVAPFGNRCIILNDAGAELRKEATPLGGEHASVNFLASEESEIAQLTAFYWVNRCAQYTLGKVGDRLQYVPTRVNLNETGNAFWDGYALNFFRSGDGFPNTAYSDVIIHEYGHAVDGRLSGIIDRGYSEGFGDALAILLTEQSQMGRDFFGPGQPMRDAREIVKWTDDDVNSGEGEPHRVGQVYAGFVWELIQRLEASGDATPFATAGRLVLDSAELNPKGIPDAIRLTLVADDNDGDLSNGTPHGKAIMEAAESRAIPLP